MAKLMIVLSREEVQKDIDYPVICETREGSRWDTMIRRRRWKEEFTDSERESCTRLFRFAHAWYLKTGVPEEVTMSLNTYSLWQRLAVFCASL